MAGKILTLHIVTPNAKPVYIMLLAILGAIENLITRIEKRKCL